MSVDEADVPPAELHAWPHRLPVPAEAGRAGRHRLEQRPVRGGRDRCRDDVAEDPIDAIVRISFDSPQQMQEALAAENYKKAHAMRETYMRETSAGIHSAVLEKTVTLV